MKKYSLPVMKKYLTELLKKIDSEDFNSINLEEFDEGDCLDLWNKLKNKYRIMKRGNRYVVLPPEPEKKKHYQTLSEKFNIDLSPLHIKEWISKQTNKENFFKVYNAAIAYLPDKDQVHLRKIKYYSERSTPRLNLDAFTRYNLSQESKEFIMKLWEIFIV